MHDPTRGRSLLPWLLAATLAAPPALGEGLLSGLAPGGSLTLTSDYIYRGVSSSNNEPAVQADLHVSTSGGTFLGVWSSTRDSALDPYANYELDIYLGHRCDLSNAWSVTAIGRAHYLLGGSQEFSDDYQELGVSVSWLDAWTFSFTAIPAFPRYWFDERLSRAPAFVTEMTAQWLIYDGLFITGGVGYYRITGTGPGIESADGYAYGDVGLAWEHRHWRLEVGYYRSGERAEVLMPYPSANQHWAGSVVWRF